MLHLTTDRQKYRVIKEYRMRLSIVICVLVIFVSLIGVASLLPSYLIAIGKVNIIKGENKNKEDAIKILNDQNFKNKIKKVDFNLSALKASINILSPKDSYDKIINSLPVGVNVNKYTYILTDNNNALINIDGTAVDRDRLLELQNKLVLNPEFSGINIPIASFTQKKDLNFSLKFNLIALPKK